MKPIEKKVIIHIKRNSENKPYATVYYQNGEELLAPATMDLATQVFANYIAKKTVTNEIKGIIYSFSEKRNVDRFDISPLTDSDYCIAGSEPGRKHVTDLIQSINDAASSKEVSAPVYLIDDYNKVLMNDELFRRNNDLMPATKEELDRKYTIIESMIAENNSKTLKKAA